MGSGGESGGFLFLKMLEVIVIQRYLLFAVLSGAVHQ
jgi:hypothetical protein